MLHIKELSETQFRQVYKERMKQDFPPSERKPLCNMLSLRRKGLYQGLGLYEGAVLCAYAFLTKGEKGAWLLLDYYAVEASLRSKGYGGVFLRLLRERFPDAAGILAESESVRSAKEEAERSLRERRIAFYLRNGMRRTGFYCELFGVEYEILYLPCGGEEALPPRQGLEEIYRTIIPSFLRKENIRFAGRENGADE